LCDVFEDKILNLCLGKVDSRNSYALGFFSFGFFNVIDNFVYDKIVFGI